ncbi:hypothetical protein [Limnohabitans sp. Rim8]|uniref:hypothetical protein n=1 Tax=Limnohabitans sp. Rim8 TaxID=1100718 RepID=UPI002606BEF5|nr:hypothetical protein [Limnohabitans sp. Rim8]
MFLMQVMGLLQNLVPRRIVREWALPGEPFSAHEAKSVGRVNPVAPPQRWTPKIQWLIDRIADLDGAVTAGSAYSLRRVSLAFISGPRAPKLNCKSRSIQGCEGVGHRR